MLPALVCYLIRLQKDCVLDDSCKFSILSESPSQLVHSWLVSILLLHLILPQKGDGVGMGFEMHLWYYMGEIGQETSHNDSTLQVLGTFPP